MHSKQKLIFSDRSTSTQLLDMYYLVKRSLVMRAEPVYLKIIAKAGIMEIADRNQVLACRTMHDLFPRRCNQKEETTPETHHRFVRG